MTQCLGWTEERIKRRGEMVGTKDEGEPRTESRKIRRGRLFQIKTKCLMMSSLVCRIPQCRKLVTNKTVGDGLILILEKLALNDRDAGIKEHFDRRRRMSSKIFFKCFAF